MDRQQWLAFIAACALNPALSHAQSVTIQSGDIYFQAEAQAPPTELTSAGLDEDAALSPDGQLVAFVRRMPGRKVETAAGQEELTELRLIRTDGTQGRILVSGRPGNDEQGELARFGNPKFSPDGLRVYFESAGGAVGNSQAIQVIELSTGTVKSVARGSIQAVVSVGQYAGDLIVVSHRYYVGGGSYDWAWLFGPDGKDVGPLGDPYEQDFQKRLNSVLGNAVR